MRGGVLGTGALCVCVCAHACVCVSDYCVLVADAREYLST